MNTNLTRSHDDSVVELLHDDPAFAAQYLNDVLADGDQEELMTALRRVAQASGGVQAVADTAKLNPTTLYRTLSPEGNPELRSFMAILNAMGMRMAISPIKA